jgi:hypothetical protein
MPMHGGDRASDTSGSGVSGARIRQLRNLIAIFVNTFIALRLSKAPTCARGVGSYSVYGEGPAELLENVMFEFAPLYEVVGADRIW